jgi:hypothetical protein
VDSLISGFFPAPGQGGGREARELAAASRLCRALTPDASWCPWRPLGPGRRPRLPGLFAPLAALNQACPAWRARVWWRPDCHPAQGGLMMMKTSRTNGSRPRTRQDVQAFPPEDRRLDLVNADPTPLVSDMALSAQGPAVEATDSPGSTMYPAGPSGLLLFLRIPLVRFTPGDAQGLRPLRPGGLPAPPPPDFAGCPSPWSSTTTLDPKPRSAAMWTSGPGSAHTTILAEYLRALRIGRKAPSTALITGSRPTPRIFPTVPHANPGLSG